MENNIEQENSEQYDFNFSALNKNQKIAVLTLLVFGFFSIVIAGSQFFSRIRSPFLISSSVNNEVIDTCVDGSCQTANQIAVSNKDTDNDGLTDQEELEYYKTSPYLADSDSDGFSDKEEIDNGTDPNCHAKMNCDTAGANETATVASDNKKIENDISDIVAGSSHEQAQIIRDMLLENEIMDAETLNQISDEDLLDAYLEASQAQ